MCILPPHPKLLQASWRAERKAEYYAFGISGSLAFYIYLKTVTCSIVGWFASYWYSTLAGEIHYWSLLTCFLNADCKPVRYVWPYKAKAHVHVIFVMMCGWTWNHVSLIMVNNTCFHFPCPCTSVSVSGWHLLSNESGLSHSRCVVSQL